MKSKLDRPCKIEDCTKPVGHYGARDMCRKHYQRQLASEKEPFVPLASVECEVPECDRLVGRDGSRGVCHKHASRRRRSPDTYTNPSPFDHESVCKYEGCEKPYQAKGYCVSHYNRYLLGRPLEGRPKAKNLIEGYPTRVVNGKQRRIHRLVMEEKLGRPLRKDEIVHHIDHNRKNYDSSNLVILSPKEHQRLHFFEQQLPRMSQEEIDHLNPMIETYGIRIETFPAT